MILGLPGQLTQGETQMMIKCSAFMFLYHGSDKIIDNISPGGTYGGVFGILSPGPTKAYGDILHTVAIPREYVIDQEALIAEVRPDELKRAFNATVGKPELWNAVVMDDFDGTDLKTIEGVLKMQGRDKCFHECQRLRGIMAAKLGYKAVSMSDEQGISYLCLPGCTICPMVDCNA